MGLDIAADRKDKKRKQPKPVKKNAIGFLEAIYLLIAAAVIGISYNYFGQSGTKVSQAEFGESWPLTVSEGRVDCLRNVQVVFYTTNGTTYGINGAAQRDYQPIDRIWCFLQSKNPHFCKQKSSVEGGEFLTI